jgi:hypothetical protein
MRSLSIILALSLVVLIPSDTEASGLSSGRSVGMAGAYSQAARGVESAFWNPANLGFSKRSDRSLTILSLGVNAHNNSFTLDQYNKYNGRFLSTEDKETILDLIPAEGLDAAMEAEALGFGLCWGNLAFTISGRGTSDLMLPKDPIEVLFFGNEINDTVLISDSDGETFASMDLGVSYGRTVWKKGQKEILCGMSARYVRGILYQKVTQAQGELFTLETGINGDGDFAVRSARGGKGYGLDLGLTFKYDPHWSFGLSLANLVSQIKWDKKTEEKGYTIEIDSLLADSFDMDSLVADESYTEAIDPFTTRVPTLIRFGAAYQGQRSLLTFDLAQGFKEGMGVHKGLKASLGTEYRMWRILDVRGGISIGGGEGVTIATGVGLNLGSYQLDLGLAIQQGLWPTKGKGVSLAITNGLNL